MGYSYYDTPDGEDCFKKLWYTTKIAAVSGLVVSAIDVRLYSHAQGLYPTAARFAHFTLPFIGMAAAFTATTCLATSVRHKNDKLNYFLGGCAAGGVYGAWRRSFVAGFAGSIILGTMAVVKKMSLEEGWEIIPEEILHSYGSLRGPVMIGPSLHLDQKLGKNQRIKQFITYKFLRMMIRAIVNVIFYPINRIYFIALFAVKA